MRGVPSVIAGTLRALTVALRSILGTKLVGVYLYGSLTQRAFARSRSDIDCLVVVRRDLSDAQFRRLRTWLARAAIADPWIPRLQMQVLRKGKLLRPDTRGCLYQFGVLKRSGSDGNPIVWKNVLDSGVTVAGPVATTFLPSITSQMLTDALEREVSYLRAEIGNPASEWRDQPFYRAYAVLTLCRILYSHGRGGVVSKPRAARWALRTLPTRWHSLIRGAVASDRGRRTTLVLPRIARFIEFVDAQLRSSAMRVPQRR
jgi:predicted nucleotidyltransferase